VTNKKIDLPINVAAAAMIKDARVQIQAQVSTKISKPIQILGDPAKRVQVGSFPKMPKTLLESD
jgi:hypothetical protein